MRHDFDISGPCFDEHGNLITPATAGKIVIPYADYLRYSEAQARIETMEAELTAERERRISAEDIVDRSLAHFPEKKLRALAYGHRLKYPKGDDHG